MIYEMSLISYYDFKYLETHTALLRKNTWFVNHVPYSIVQTMHSRGEDHCSSSQLPRQGRVQAGHAADTLVALLLVTQGEGWEEHQVFTAHPWKPIAVIQSSSVSHSSAQSQDQHHRHRLLQEGSLQ